MTFSEKLQLLRKQKGLSQEALAEALSVSRQSVSKWEAQQAYPDITKVIALGEIFDVTIDQLLKDDLAIISTPCPESAIEQTEGFIEQTSISKKLDIVFCTQCGKENRSDSQFCGYCGSPFMAFVAGRGETGELTKADMDLAYYRANLQLQQQALQMQQQEIEEARRQTEQQRQQLLFQRKQYDDMMKCPCCGSTSLSGNKKGYGIGKGIVGAAFFGPLGLVAGNIGSVKVMVTCIKCGHKFKAERKGGLK